jgi:hypothetical protein
MSPVKGQVKTLGTAICIAAVVVALVVFAALHVRLPQLTENKSLKPTNPAVGLVRADHKNALFQQVELFDNKALFLPTPINNSDPDLPSTLHREPDSAFKVIPPKWTFVEYEMKVALPDPVVVPDNLVEALYTGETPNPFFTFGRINFPYAPLSSRLAFLEVLQAKTGRTMLAAPLPRPQAGNLPAVDWQPLEMMVVVESVGLIGEPTVTSGSGFEDVDNFFRGLIAKQFRLGARLPPGFYTLRIGP